MRKSGVKAIKAGSVFVCLSVLLFGLGKVLGSKWNDSPIIFIFVDSNTFALISLGMGLVVIWMGRQLITDSRALTRMSQTLSDKQMRLILREFSENPWINRVFVGICCLFLFFSIIVFNLYEIVLSSSSINELIQQIDEAFGLIETLVYLIFGFTGVVNVIKGIHSRRSLLKKIQHLFCLVSSLM